MGLTRRLLRAKRAARAGTARSCGGPALLSFLHNSVSSRNERQSGGYLKNYAGGPPPWLADQVGSPPLSVQLSSESARRVSVFEEWGVRFRGPSPRSG